MNIKYCRSCELDHPIDLFNFKNKLKGIYKSVCKVCEKAYNADRYNKNKSKIQEQNQNWKQANQEKYLKYQAEYNKKHRK